MNIVIIGIGLIGGSFAKALKQYYPSANFIGIDTNEAHLEEALALGLINQKGDYTALASADVAFVSVPVDALLQVLPEILDAVGEKTVVVDVGSTKNAICQAVANHPKRRNFLACHPMAGTEFSGPSAALSGLYEGKNHIICEAEKTDAELREKALQLFQKLHMRIHYMDPEVHDKHIAYISHLSHICSFMLGKTVIEKEKSESDIFNMAASGFESTVRLAKSSPAMWTPIFAQNKTNVLEALEEYIQNLQHFKQLLVQDDFENIYQEMSRTNRIKQILKKIENTKKQ